MAIGLRFKVNRAADQFAIHADDFTIAGAAALCLLALLLGSDSGDHTVGLIAAPKNLSRGAAQLRFAGMLRGSGGQGKCQ